MYHAAAVCLQTQFTSQVKAICGLLHSIKYAKINQLVNPFCRRRAPCGFLFVYQVLPICFCATRLGFARNLGIADRVQSRTTTGRKPTSEPESACRWKKQGTSRCEPLRMRTATTHSAGMQSQGLSKPQHP